VQEEISDSTQPVTQCDIPEGINTHNELIQCNIYKCNTNRFVTIRMSAFITTTCSSYYTSRMKEQTSDMHAFCMCLCIPNQTIDQFYVLPPVFVTCSSTQGNKQISHTLDTLTIK